MKDKKTKIIKGKDIVHLQSVVQFGDDCHLKARTENGETLMIPLETLFPILDEYIFVAEKKRRYYSLISGSPIDLNNSKNLEYE